VQKQYKNIVIFKTGAVGDFIAATIGIRAIREQFPKAKITLVTNRPNDQTCPPGSLINKFVDYGKINSRGYWSFYRSLKRESFDLAVNLKWHSEFFAFLCKMIAPESAGTGKGVVKSLYTYSPEVDVYDDPNRHEYLLNLDIAESIGFRTSNPKAFVYTSDSEELFAQQFYEENSINNDHNLIIAPGASTPLKAWPKEKYVDIGKRFVQEYDGSVIISWAPEDEKVAKFVAEQIGEGAVMTPATSLRQIFALVARSKMVLCNNSGILHMAYARDVPVICMNTSIGWAPYGRFGVSVDSIDPERRKNNRTISNEEISQRLMKISADRTWNVLREKWSEFYPDKDYSVVG